MLAIVGPRCSGKSYELIRMAHENDQYIITSTRKQADQLTVEAKRHGLAIRDPVSVHECLVGRLNRTPYARFHPGGGVMVDDAAAILTDVLHLPRIDAISICARDCLQLETRLPQETIEQMRILGQEIDE